MPFVAHARVRTTCGVQIESLKSLNARIRDEPLNAPSLITIVEARREAADSRQDDSEVQSPSALGVRHAKGVRGRLSKPSQRQVIRCVRCNWRYSFCCTRT